MSRSGATVAMRPTTVSGSVERGPGRSIAGALAQRLRRSCRARKRIHDPSLAGLFRGDLIAAELDPAGVVWIQINDLRREALAQQAAM